MEKCSFTQQKVEFIENKIPNINLMTKNSNIKAIIK